MPRDIYMILLRRSYSDVSIQQNCIREPQYKNSRQYYNAGGARGCVDDEERHVGGNQGADT